MLYVKIIDASGEIVAAEAYESPVYVQYLKKNKLFLRCSAVSAQGILSADSSTVYQLEGRQEMPGVDLTAVEITMTEYEEISSSQAPTPSDPEDEDPVIPDGGSTEDIMTRAELTEKVLALEDELTAAKILLGVE